MLPLASCDEAGEQAEAVRPMQVLNFDLPQGQTGEPYRAPLIASGGTLPYSWSIQRGSLPVGLSLDEFTGAITGTPENEEIRVITVQVVDSSFPAQTAAVDVKLWVLSPAMIASTQEPVLKRISMR